MSDPIGDDDFFAVQVTEGLDDDRAILVVGDEQIIFDFGDFGDLAGAIETLKPIEVRLSPATHERWVAELARQGVHPSKIQ